MQRFVRDIDVIIYMIFIVLNSGFSLSACPNMFIKQTDIIIETNFRTSNNYIDSLLNEPMLRQKYADYLMGMLIYTSVINENYEHDIEQMIDQLPVLGSYTTMGVAVYNIYEKGNYESAENFLLKSIELDTLGCNKWANYMLSWLYYYYFFDDKAANKFVSDALKIDNEFSFALIHKAQMLDKDRDCAKMVNYLEKSRQRYYDEYSLFLLGRSYYGCLDISNAQKFANMSLKLRANPDAHILLGMIHSLNLNNELEAIFHFDSALNLTQDPTQYIEIAWGFYTLNRYEESERLLIEATTLINDKFKQLAYDELIIFYLLTGNIESAKYFNDMGIKESGVNFHNASFEKIINILSKPLDGGSFKSLAKLLNSGNMSEENEWIRNTIGRLNSDFSFDK